MEMTRTFIELADRIISAGGEFRTYAQTMILRFDIQLSRLGGGSL